jgi:hypothetical protein
MIYFLGLRVQVLKTFMERERFDDLTYFLSLAVDEALGELLVLQQF